MRSETDGDNLVDFFKENLMVAKMFELELEKWTKETAAEVFREVLGYKSGFAKGLSEMVISKSSKQRNNERIAELSITTERHEKDAEYYKRQLEELRGDVQVLLEQQTTYDKFISTYMSERWSQ
ncbi:uncharacterized protein LOC122314147 [Carya illinoinensis]|uniref:uncharacterized protein LOC122314147 n=1 Tax=Carya illinoinensis TaxID=32201 RepID=UPI001C71EC13|nr:uncharacterized protein LOC122314147 [Carya illinoinensis]